MRRRTSFNPKRQIRRGCSRAMLAELERRVTYGGNPEHKRNPGDFGLTPPAQPRADKTLCDNVGIFSRSRALRLLKSGIRRGLVSRQERQGYPQNIWAVAPDGQALEAQLENAETGAYHGYPMQDIDPMAAMVTEHWHRT